MFNLQFFMYLHALFIISIICLIHMIVHYIVYLCVQFIIIIKFEDSMI